MICGTLLKIRLLKFTIITYENGSDILTLGNRPGVKHDSLS